MYDPSVVAWEWVSPDERAVAFARRDIAAVLPSGWKVDMDADGEIGIIGPVQAVREALAVLGIEVPE